MTTPETRSTADPRDAAPKRGRRRADRLPSGRILVVEDEYWVAEALARQIVADGSAVAGPVPTAEAALDLLKQIPDLHGAVLDVRLRNGKSFPVAEELRRRGIPFVFYTADPHIDWPIGFRAAPKTSKSADWRDLKCILFGIRAPRKSEQSRFHDDVAAAIPRLRDIARTLAPSPELADSLVEQALEQATVNVRARETFPSVEAWLLSLLQAEADRRDAFH